METVLYFIVKKSLIFFCMFLAFITTLLYSHKIYLLDQNFIVLEYHNNCLSLKVF